MTFAEALEGNTEIKVHAPTLGPDMRPDFQLVNMQCPKGLDGHCEACDHLVGVDLSETDGAVFSYHQFPAICRGQSIKARLEYLRGEIQAERISYGEISELQSLADHIEQDDVLLLEWAGVPEFPEPTED